MNFARRLVLNTGVLVSAAIRPQSIPALTLEKALLQFEVCACHATLQELETVLRHSKFDQYLPAVQRKAFITGFRDHVTVFDVTQIVSDCPDPKDNVFLALADTAMAELTISSDPHLTNLHPWHSILIMPPSAFLVGMR